jgi:hypothetical protein
MTAGKKRFKPLSLTIPLVRLVKGRGFFCFLVLLAFSLLFLALSEQDRAIEGLSASTAMAIEAEKVNFVRTLLEENSDFIIRETMESELQECPPSPQKVKEKINRALLNYFEEMEKCCGGISVDFSAGKGGLGMGFLNRNSALIVKRSGNTCTMRYSFHGGIARSEFVSATISGKNFSQPFIIPAGYAQEATGVIIG